MGKQAFSWGIPRERRCGAQPRASACGGAVRGPGGSGKGAHPAGRLLPSPVFFPGIKPPVPPGVCGTGADQRRLRGKNLPKGKKIYLLFIYYLFPRGISCNFGAPVRGNFVSQRATLREVER